LIERSPAPQGAGLFQWREMNAFRMPGISFGLRKKAMRTLDHFSFCDSINLLLFFKELSPRCDLKTVADKLYR